MQTDDKTINHLNLQRLVASGAQVGVEVVGGTGGWGEVIIYGRASQTLAGYLKELGIVEYRVNAAAAVELDQEFEAKAEYARRRPKLHKPGRVHGTREIVVRPN